MDLDLVLDRADLLGCLGTPPGVLVGAAGTLVRCVSDVLGVVELRSTSGVVVLMSGTGLARAYSIESSALVSYTLLMYSVLLRIVVLFDGS